MTAAKLTYTAITSLDGFMEDQSGKFDWAAPDVEVHEFINDLERQTGTHLYGRKLYEVMKVWEHLDSDDQPPALRDYARIWQAADKVVYSTTLAEVESWSVRV